MLSPLLETYNLYCADLRVPVRPKLGDWDLRTGVRADGRASPGASRFCADRVWGHPAERRLAGGDHSSVCQRAVCRGKVTPVLGVDGHGVGDVVGVAGDVDLPRSLLAPRGP